MSSSTRYFRYGPYDFQDADCPEHGLWFEWDSDGRPFCSACCWERELAETATSREVPCIPEGIRLQQPDPFGPPPRGAGMDVLLSIIALLALGLIFVRPSRRDVD